MKRLLLCLTATAALSLGARLSADDSAPASPSPWTIGLRASDFVPADKSSAFTTNSSSVAPNQIKFSSFVYPELDLGYELTDNISITASGTVPQNTNVTTPNGTIGHVQMLPTSLTADFNFIPDGPIQPYVGAGVGGNFITRESNLTTGAGGTIINFKSPAFAEVVEAGASFRIVRGLHLNVNVRKELSDTRLYANGLYTSKIDLDPWIFSVGVSHRF